MQKIILITGGTGGLGEAMARRFSKVENNKVIILDLDKVKGQALSKELGIDFILTDITKENEIKKAIEKVLKKYGKIDVLINNAGIWLEENIENCTKEKIEKLMDVNVIGTMLVTKNIVPIMKKQNKNKKSYTRIINVISQVAFQAKPNREVYYASKYALRGFTDCLAIELAPFNISVCGFYPDGIKTKLFKNAGDDLDTSAFMEIEDVVSSLEFILNMSPKVNIPILSMKSLEKVN